MEVSDKHFTLAESAYRAVAATTSRSWQDCLRAAIDALPDPQRMPEPVPGAAVRALPCAWATEADELKGGNALIRAETLDRCREQLQAALRADGLASVELPTREAVAEAIRSAKFGGGDVPAPWDEVDQRVRDNWLAAADKAIELLARRPATDEAEALRVRLLDAMGVGPSHRSAETWPWERIISDQAAGLQRWHDKLQQCAGLESQLASVTDERDRLSVSARNAYHDGYREAQSQKHAADERARVATDERDEALTGLAKVERGYQEATRKADDHRRQRDGLQDKLASVTDERDRAQRCSANWERECEAARAELAARPEPVVIDEALAERVCRGYWGSLAPASVDVGLMLTCLKRALGDRASVSVPQGVGMDWADVANQYAAERDQLRAELEKTRAEHQATAAEFRAYVERSDGEIEKANADLAACRAERDTWLGEHGRVSAELEDCRNTKDGRINELGNQLIDLREQHEALRTELECCKAKLARVAEVAAS